MAEYGNKIRRKEAVGMDELVSQFIREMRLSSGINRQRVTEAWNVVSGASRYTLSVSYVGAVVYVALNSSMARNQLYYQRDVLIRKMNEYLASDSLFVGDGKGGPAVRNLMLK
ncbi:MAG: DUF721 domain-containing protein [Bacteroidales bacterium]|nr:DUF721 domain-containing protein [Bacteroidales bacterium]